MVNLKALKNAVKIETVIRESGFALVPSEDGRFLVGQDVRELKVDLQAQRYTWKDREINESGDVLSWLKARYRWSMPFAINYLQNLPDQAAVELLNQAQAPEPDEEQLIQFPTSRIAESLWTYDKAYATGDRGIQEALRIGYDFSEWSGDGIETLLGYGKFEMMRKHKHAMPVQFIQLTGVPGDDRCWGCDKDLTAWEIGGSFLAVKIKYGKPEGGMVIEVEGFYCASCVNRFRRWARAIDLIFNSTFMRSQWREAAQRTVLRGGGAV